ncbi:O-antigen ligase family protein [Rhizobium sp. LjRoot30]|uniref:O-antigen ligase family protein n=1 Tax=Rhizobium sp. LjRoot30 TaxID=3342320 RepID=UPI003ECEB4D3
MNASRLFETTVVLALIVSTGTFAPSLQTPTGMAAESGFLNQSLLLCTFAAVIGLGLLGRGIRFRGAVSEWLLGVVLFWSALSVFWSARPEATAVRSFALMLTMLVAVFAVQTLGRRDFIALAGRAILIVLAINVLVVFFLPQTGIAGFPTDGAWRGLFTQKNVLGRIALIGVLIGLFRVFSPGRRKRTENLVLLCSSVVVIIGTRSATAVAVLIIALGLLTLVLILRHARVGIGVATFGVGLGGLLAASVALLTFDEMAAAIGRNATLSGRLPLWDELLRIGGKAPLLGKGYGAFWSPENEDVILLWSRLGWMPVQAHNGYIEIFLQLGAVGLVLVVLMLVSLGCSSFIRFMRGGDGTWLLAFILAVAIVVLSLTEAVLLVQNNIFTILFVALLPGSDAVADTRLPRQEGTLEDPVPV